MKGLTDNQNEMYDLIKYYIKKEGYAPSIRELGELLELKSTQTVHSRLKILENKGIIKIVPNISRGIVLINKK